MHLAHMERKLKKYVRYLLINQTSSSLIHERWTYSCQLCSLVDTHRSMLYDHVERCHSTQTIVNFLLDLVEIPGVQEVIEHFCKDEDNYQ